MDKQFSSMITLTSFTKINFQPLRCARTAISISSTVVLSSQPPDSSRVLILQTPAVPLNPKKLRNAPLTCCSTSKWKHKLMFWRRVNKFSSLFTKAHLAWTRPNSGLSCNRRRAYALKITLNTDLPRIFVEYVWCSLLNLEIWHGLLKKIRIWLEICVENCNKLIVFHIVTAHCRLEIPCFISSPD